jgi:hypothetical protein
MKNLRWLNEVETSTQCFANEELKKKKNQKQAQSRKEKKIKT